jgi:hypothetical protein
VGGREGGREGERREGGREEFVQVACRTREGGRKVR